MPSAAGPRPLLEARSGSWFNPMAVRWIVVVVLLFAAILIPFAIWGEALDQWVDTVRWTGMSSGLAAVLGAALLAADIVLPIPSSVIGTMLGTVLGAWLGTLVGAAGLTAGCVVGYAIGWMLGAQQSRRAAAWIERYGIVALVLCRAVPILAEASIIMAGALRLAPVRAFTAITLANVGISAVYATLGATATDASGFLLALVLAVAFPGAVLVATKVVERMWRAR